MIDYVYDRSQNSILGITISMLTMSDDTHVSNIGRPVHELPDLFWQH
jgi:hypothetical protein